MGSQQLNTVFLRLEGVLQSWGERGRWTVRDTATIPTKSGVIGLIGAAMGINDNRLSELSSRLEMGVRVDKPGTLMHDYHTVISGVVKSEGGIKGGKNPETVVSHRYYLNDASFLVALRQSDPVDIKSIAVALQCPKWFLYLGRHCCIPSRPIYAGVGSHVNLFEALSIIDGKDHEYEIHDGIDDGTIMRMDEIANFTSRYFRPRFVSRMTVTANVEGALKR